MPLPSGGRADKLGNRYEGRWVVYQLLELIKEDIQSVTIEPIGEDEQGVDLIIKHTNGTVEHHQCKARNSSKEYWTLGDIKSRGIFDHALYHLSRNPDIHYHLVSPLYCMMLNDIIELAKNSNDNPQDFYNCQIQRSGKDVKEGFTQLMGYFRLDESQTYDISTMFDYLQRLNIQVYADDTQAKQDLLHSINYLFVGDEEAIYSLLKDYAVETYNMGKAITLTPLINYLNKHGFEYRLLSKNNRILPRMHELNSEFNGYFHLINGRLIHRDESDDCYNDIKKEKSLIIHGRAGYGKSGCVFELVQHLQKEFIPYLALKLDHRMPNNSSQQYGGCLDLPNSPVNCLNAISKDSQAVLILDQLDAIRWTNQQSGTALEVVKEMIREIIQRNLEREKKLSLVLVCRTFDLENDYGIKNLIEKTDSPDSVDFETHQIHELSAGNMISCIGDIYNTLAPPLKKLISIPSNLYIWTYLNETNKNIAHTSSIGLIEAWWKQLLAKYTIKEAKDLNHLKDTLVENITKLGKMQIPDVFFSDFPPQVKNALVSEGLLSDTNGFSFVHQSYYDYFIVQKWLKNIYSDISILDLLGDKSSQTPHVRYQLQMTLEHLVESDPDKFICVGREILASEGTRFYMKYLFLEVLGQVKTIHQSVKDFILEYIELTEWLPHLIDTVFLGHVPIIEKLIEDEYIAQWFNDDNMNRKALSLLRSVNEKIPDLVVAQLIPITSNNNAINIYNTLCRNIEDDSHNMFDLRSEEHATYIWDYLSMSSIRNS